ncbi:MAG: 2-oxo acid dehydrogenase subunit E2 [Desulfobacterales bacterium]|nr:2-oxo acid dehydrogenase subunit E2 [Desulfobacterales bacterium]
MFEFKLPDLGEGIHEGELLQWHVSVGDKINEDDPLCEMETDKAAVTIPSPRTGVISALNANPGDTIEVGSVFVVIDDGSDSSADSGVSSGTEVLEARGVTGVADSSASDRDTPEPSAKPDVGKGRAIAAPATRRLAREMGIDIRMVRGTGPGGRITPEDLNAFEAGGGIKGTVDSRGGAEQEKSVAEPLGQTPSEMPSSFDASHASSIPFLEVPYQAVPDHGPVERVPIRSLRKKTAVKTTSSSILMPHVAHMDDIDVTLIEEKRKEYNARHGEKGKLTLLAFVIKAVAAGLKSYPMFNASVDLSSNEIVHKYFYNIGFAADTPRGLMVPVIHDADRQSLAGIGYRISHLAGLARDGKISVDELTRGTFSITNVGAIGGTHVFPIINAPESAILGLGRVEQKPVVRDGQIVIRDILPITLCFDHRVADGAQAAAFVKQVKEMLEDDLVFLAGT